MGIAFTGDDMGKLFLSEDEHRQLWDVEDIPHGQAAARWESPDKRAERYRQALEGILACSGGGRVVYLLQAVAARSLGYDELERELLRRADVARDDPPCSG
jgi:hypothetical protein